MKTNRNTRSLRAGGYSIALSAIVIAAVVVLNLLVGKLPSSITKPETSSVKLYDFDDQTRAIAEGVSEDVTISVWAEKDAADKTLDEFLTRYAALNSRIHIRYVDPALNPTFMEQYADEAPAENSLVVESAKRARVIEYGYTEQDLFGSLGGVANYTYTSKIYTYSYTEDQLYQYYMYYGSLPSPDVFDAENVVTNAVDYVTTDVLPTVYMLTGHNESTLGANLQARLEQENIASKSLSLVTEAEVPADCDLLLLAAPEKDLTAEEVEKIQTYIENGGHVLLYTSYTAAAPEHLASLCAAYGMKAVEGVVFEQDANAYAYRYNLIATLESHAITDPLISAGSYVIVPAAHGIQTLDAYRSSLTVTPLLKTSDGAYLKNMDTMTSGDKEAGDAEGPFLLAAIATETIGGKTGSFIWISSDALFEDSTAVYGNTDFIMNLFGYSCEKQNAVTVRSVSLAVEPLVVSESESHLWSILLTVILPVLAVGAGLLIWFKRRSR